MEEPWWSCLLIPGITLFFSLSTDNGYQHDSDNWYLCRDNAPDLDDDDELPGRF